MGTYFFTTWPNDITEANLLAAFPQLQPYLKFYSSRQQAEYTQIANENQHAAQTLIAWLNTQGKPGQLVNQGPKAYENLSLLLIELRGREITPKTISQAEGRISYKPGRQLHYVSVPRQEDPRQHAMAEGETFLGKDVNLPLWKKKQLEREEQDRRNGTAVAAQPSEADAWTQVVEGYLRRGPHSEQAASKTEYDRALREGKSMRQIAAILDDVHKNYVRLNDRAPY